MTDNNQGPEQDEQRRQKVIQEMRFRKFLDQHFPEDAGTLIDFRKLIRVAHKRGENYRNAKPFPHIVIDDFLPQESFDAVYDALPSLSDERIRWANLNVNLGDGRAAQAQKYHLMNVLFMKPALRQLIFELNSGPFMTFLSRMTGIPLTSDPQLQGGGVHRVQRGGLLRVHADFSKHGSYNIDRRLNLLLYCNKDWKEEYGGHLELWDSQMTTCVKRVLPIANRCVIFNTTSDSFHGHPHPLTCPEGVDRTTIAAYYYSGPSPKLESRPEHETLWQDLPEERQQ